MKSVYEFEENNIDDLENELSTEQKRTPPTDHGLREHTKTTKKMLKIAAGKHHGTSDEGQMVSVKTFNVVFGVFFLRISLRWKILYVVEMKKRALSIYPFSS
jgi:hypothetical protein